MVNLTSYNGYPLFISPFRMYSIFIFATAYLRKHYETNQDNVLFHQFVHGNQGDLIQT